jgi:ribosome-associated toxin RatA of RatAB toxin-antitoxin module
MILRSFLSPITKRHVERKILAVPALHLFRIVADVDAYWTFLPLCRRSRITRRLPPLLSPDKVVMVESSSVGNNAINNKDMAEQRFEAQLTVGMPPFLEETYTSLVVANPARLTIASTSIQSQNIEKLTSLWQLREIENDNNMGGGKGSCEVQLEVSMTVRDPIIVAALDQVLASVARQQVAAFSQRCLETPIIDYKEQ